MAALALAAALSACEPDPPGVAFSGDAQAGRAALQQYDCGVCHRIPGVRGAVGLVGPPLEGFGTRVYITGRFPNSEAMLVRWIIDPPALAPSTAMPAVGVDEADARDMAAYLLSLR
jgi:cytochrome c2